MSNHSGPLTATVTSIAAMSREVRFPTGMLIFTVSERRLVKFEAVPYVRICKIRQVWQSVPGENRLAIDVAANHLDKMEPTIVDPVGAYGVLKATLEDHEVAELAIHVLLRPTRRRRSQSKCLLRRQRPRSDLGIGALSTSRLGRPRPALPPPTIPGRACGAFGHVS